MGSPKPPERSLASLPEELILAILDKFDSDDLATFRALNITSRQLYRLSLPRLYQRFPGHAPEPFLGTIALSEPEKCQKLATFVKEVEWYQDHWKGPARRRMLSLADRHVLSTKLQALGCILNTTDTSMNLPARFISFLSEYEVHWWYLEFFLFFTPNVERLCVWDVWQWDDHSYWFESVAANPAYFENLKSITLYGPLRLENIVPLLTLPSIRELVLVQCVTMRQELGRDFSWSNGRDGYVQRRLADGSSLEHLSLRESHITFSSVRALLEPLNNLKSFTYDHFQNDLSFPIYAESQALVNVPAHWKSLEYLRLHVERVSNVEEIAWLLGSAPVFDEPTYPNLRTLDIGPCSGETFLGAQLSPSDSSVKSIRLRESHVERSVRAIPRTLETLYLQWGQATETPRDSLPHHLLQFLNYLRLFAEIAARWNYDLKRVAICDWPALAGWFPFPEAAESLKKAYEELGMEFDVLHEEIIGQEPLVVRDDIEPDWLVVCKTTTFWYHSNMLGDKDVPRTVQS
ncbi:hypothetical protein PtrSN002B_011697 [Pyrenophora tritici-repentis]|uniref:F-box domain containing protein n=1 Tax=Pyrenophora tritici-repentis TaxID=45151 RepID=A0A2W1D0D2_9PLEO|nr:hypothetical protein PtrV1_08927 [Pyrenophora tritici-repentis]KAF7441855.1 hypothetical protein A1F99_137070 [Pyrenophora tritici-repentis]KAF7567864.1 F-box domain containing protein [Pyrenophora tritici-repentis]KAG9376660.1 hypothetical protein A1F94_012260 [Pyrenophora tritici-repentis]KAI0569450.1 hypothetical protein Alg215_11630 [Pyrenophora tritici-repentis]